MKSLVIIVPGSNIKYPLCLKNIVNIYCKYFGIDPAGDYLFTEFKQYLINHMNLDAEVFVWSGGIIEFLSLKPAAKQLAQLLVNNKDRHEIILFGKSLGGRVAELAIQLTNFQQNISRILYIATPHTSKNTTFPNSIKQINVYSKEDNYVRFANKLLYGNFFKLSVDQAYNVVIPGLRHSKFNTNRQIMLKNKTYQLFELYSNLIINSLEIKKTNTNL